MIAIKTVYKGPTNTKGAYIVAKAGGHSLTLPLDMVELGSSAEYHAFAARWLCTKMNWSTDIIGGGLDDGSYVFVFRKQ